MTPARTCHADCATDCAMDCAMAKVQTARPASPALTPELPGRRCGIFRACNRKGLETRLALRRQARLRRCQDDRPRVPKRRWQARATQGKAKSREARATGAQE